MTTWTLGDIAKALNLSRSSIRNFTLEFADELSEKATVRNATRRYNKVDFALLWFVKQCRDESLSYEEIQKKIQKGEHRGIELPIELTQPPPNTSSQTVDELKGRISVLESQLTYFKQELASERQARLEAEKRAAAAEAQLNLLQRNEN